MRRIVKSVTALLALVVALSGCYVPDDFLAEVRLAKNGDYALTYKGILTWVPLWQDIRAGKLTGEEIREKTEAVRADLMRDQHFTEIAPLGQGRFRVHYERFGRFTGTRQVSFPRRGAEIIILEMRTDNQLYLIVSPKLSIEQQDRLAKAGAPVDGKFRVISNAAVAGHNAEHVQKGMPGYPDWTVYDWSIESIRSPRPVFVANFM